MVLFKNEELKAEFERLNPRLQHVIYWLAGWASLNTKTRWVLITELLRTKEQQNENYKDNPEYQEKPWNSVHEYGRGADIRSHEFVNRGDDVEKIVAAINREFDYGDGVHQTALYHNSGQGKHIHLQVKA